MGCPAHAGIDPQQDGTTSYDVRLPRTRGDRPVPQNIDPIIAAVAPHTRG